MILRGRRLAWTFLVVGCAGCAGEPPPGITQVMSRPDCKHIDKGARLIGYEELAKLRGANLIQMEAPQGSADPLRLIGISLGKHAAPGKQIIVQQVTRTGPAEMTVAVALDEPPWDQLREQATANPCLVLGFDDPDVKRVRIESGDALLGAIEFESTAQ